MARSGPARALALTVVTLASVCAAVVDRLVRNYQERPKR
jgi:hypothetical protein